VKKTKTSDETQDNLAELGLDIELDLSINDESSLLSSPDFTKTEIDDGLNDLSLSLDMNLPDTPGDSEGLKDLDLGEESEKSFTGLTLSDDLGLDEDVMSKLAEIDQMMEDDPTGTKLQLSVLKEELKSDPQKDKNVEEAIHVDLDSEFSLDLGPKEEDKAKDLDPGPIDLSGIDFNLEDIGLKVTNDQEEVEEKTIVRKVEKNDLTGINVGLIDQEDFNLDSLDFSIEKDEATRINDLKNLKPSLPESPDLSFEMNDFNENENEAKEDIGFDHEVQTATYQDENDAATRVVSVASSKDSATKDLEEIKLEEESFDLTPENEDNIETLFTDASHVSIKEEKPFKKEQEIQINPIEKQENRQIDFNEISGNYNHELEKLRATIQQLRIDREDLLKKIQEHEDERIQINRTVLSMRAQLDEKKIEIELMKKRSSSGFDDLKYNLALESEKRSILEQKVKALLDENQELQQKIKLEVRKVGGREKELEQKLELLRMDSENQIRLRDMKILELKRKVDALEFDVETLSSHEKKNVDEKVELESKLDKAIRTLRSAISVLESDDQKIQALEKMKKNLDL
jgi:hypothetical protein